jgi:hypothetical protein
MEMPVPGKQALTQPSQAPGLARRRHLLAQRRGCRLCDLRDGEIDPIVSRGASVADWSAASSLGRSPLNRALGSGTAKSRTAPDNVFGCVFEARSLFGETAIH